MKRGKDMGENGNKGGGKKKAIIAIIIIVAALVIFFVMGAIKKSHERPPRPGEGPGQGPGPGPGGSVVLEEENALNDVFYVSV